MCGIILMKWSRFIITLVIVILGVYEFFAISYGIEYTLSKYMQVLGIKSQYIVFS